MKILIGGYFLILLVFSGFSSGQQRLSYSDFTITQEHRFDETGNASSMSLSRMLLPSPDKQADPMTFLSLLTYDEGTRYILLAYLSFYSNADKCRFPETPEVELDLDGEKVLIKSPFLAKEDLSPEEIKKGMATSFNNPVNGKCKESLELILPHDLYLKVTGTKKRISVRTGKIQFALEGRALFALNEMAKRIRHSEVLTEPKSVKKKS